MKSVVVIALSLALVACGKESQTVEQPPATHAQETASAPSTSTTTAQAASEHTIDVAGEFSPASVTIPADTAVRLHFRRSDKPTCADEIVLPELNQRKKIAANETVTFELPPQQARTLTFACGMNMMKGSVVVQ